MSDPIAICLAISVAINAYAYLLLRNRAKQWRKDFQDTINRLYWLKGGKPVKPAPDYFEYWSAKGER